MHSTGVSLTLSHEGHVLLQEVLEERDRTLVMEISQTDHHEFKDALRKKAELLASVLSRVKADAA